MVRREAPTQERSIPDQREPLPPESALSAKLLDPVGSVRAKDTLFSDLVDGAWNETQQHSREVYDLMMRDPSVSGPFNLLLSMLKSLDFEFRAQMPSATDKQKEMAEFMNAQIQRLGLPGHYSSGWDKFLDGFVGNGLKYGFGLAEISTKLANWNGRPYVQLEEVRVLPQRSLDDSNFFEVRSTSTARDLDLLHYNCFRFNNDGRVVSYVQNRNQQNEIEWAGNETKRILHYTHRGGDGNPFGQSILWEAYWPWSDKYVAERLEQWKLENADSFMTMSYDSDTPLPEVHKQVVEQISQAGSGIPILVAPRAEWGSVSVISEAYTNHIQTRKRELRTEISQGILVPESLFKETETSDVDSRNLIQVFFKFRLPAIIREVCNMLTWQLGKRLIDANYQNVEPTDYPVCRAKVRLDNDLRVMAPLLQQLISYIDSDRLGEFVEEMLPGMQREWIPDEHDDSVAIKRPLDEHAPEGVVGFNEPPPKQPGENRERTDGQTENPSGTTDTVAGGDEL